jgi:hypothetical protein
MSYIDDYIWRIEEVTVPALQKELETLESGKLRAGKRYVPGAWIDTTREEILRLKDAIAEHQSILEAFRKGDFP